MKSQLGPSSQTVSQFRLTTEEFAEVRRLKAQSVRKRYSETGSYFGIRPLRLPNRRLLWPVDEF